MGKTKIVYQVVLEFGNRRKAKKCLTKIKNGTPIGSMNDDIKSVGFNDPNAYCDHWWKCIGRAESPYFHNEFKAPTIFEVDQCKQCGLTKTRKL